MVLGFLKGIFDYNKREVKKLWPIVDIINNLESKMQSLTDAELGARPWSSGIV